MLYCDCALRYIQPASVERHLSLFGNGALYCGDSCQAEEADTQQSMQFLDAAVKRVI